jgi:hypothetical protein
VPWFAVRVELGADQGGAPKLPPRRPAPPTTPVPSANDAAGRPGVTALRARRPPPPSSSPASSPLAWPKPEKPEVGPKPHAEALGRGVAMGDASRAWSLAWRRVLWPRCRAAAWCSCWPSVRGRWPCFEVGSGVRSQSAPGTRHSRFATTLR